MKYYATITHNSASQLYSWRFYYPGSITGPRYSRAHTERFSNLVDVISEIIDTINSTTMHPKYSLQVTYYRRNLNNYYADGNARPCLIEMQITTRDKFNLDTMALTSELFRLDETIGGINPI